MYLHIVDAATGRVLYRRDLVQSDSGQAWDYYPGAPAGGSAGQADTVRPGSSEVAATLKGNTAHVYSDVNDDNVAQPTEEVTPTKNRQVRLPVPELQLASARRARPRSRARGTRPRRTRGRSTASQNARPGLLLRQQVPRPPRGRADRLHPGGRQLRGSRRRRRSTARRRRRRQHRGRAARRQPHRQRQHGHPARRHPAADADVPVPRPGRDPTDPFLPANGGDEADIVYHEYTHGLSNRLVVDANGNSTLGNVQAGSMGEAWSDWYAMDFLVKQGFEPDTAADGELSDRQVRRAGGQDLIRTQPLDCPVGVHVGRLPRHAGRGHRRLHLRRLRPDHRRARGARRR